MLVKDVIAGIQNKELTIQSLADKYKVSTRTIQNKIKGAGYRWQASKAVYEFIGQDIAIQEQDFDSLFNSTSKSNNTNKSKSNSRSESKSKNASSSKSESKVSEPESIQELDAIDVLLSGKKASKDRVYRGFYFDKDVLSILDKSGNKSELINQALRKVFKDKGLL